VRLSSFADKNNRKKPGTVTTKTVKPCTYGITMTKKAPNPEAAKDFPAFLLSPLFQNRPEKNTWMNGKILPASLHEKANSS